MPAPLSRIFTFRRSLSEDLDALRQPDASAQDLLEALYLENPDLETIFKVRQVTATTEDRDGSYTLNVVADASCLGAKPTIAIERATRRGAGMVIAA